MFVESNDILDYLVEVFHTSNNYAKHMDKMVEFCQTIADHTITYSITADLTQDRMIALLEAGHRLIEEVKKARGQCYYIAASEPYGNEYMFFFVGKNEQAVLDKIKKVIPLL